MQVVNCLLLLMVLPPPPPPTYVLVITPLSVSSPPPEAAAAGGFNSSCLVGGGFCFSTKIMYAPPGGNILVGEPVLFPFSRLFHIKCIPCPGGTYPSFPWESQFFSPFHISPRPPGESLPGVQKPRNTNYLLAQAQDTQTTNNAQQYGV